MTTTAIMPARSRSSRVLRKDPDNEPGENSIESIEPPPPKRPRLMNPAPTRRRKSSPDLLDTTIDSTPSISASASSSASSTLRRPRPLFALSTRTGTSTGTTSSPPPGLAGATPARARNTPSSISTAFYLNGDRESPDPLDTISPAPAPVAKSAPKPKPKPPTAAAAAATPTSTAYRQRRLTHYLKPQSESVKQEEEQSTPKPKPKTSSFTTRPAQTDPQPQPQPPTPPDNPPQQSLPVPVETADRGQQKRRSLRSHDGGSRAKSELAQYFPNYDQLLSLEPQKTELLSGNTVIKLVHDVSEPISNTLKAGEDAPFGNPLVNLHNCDIITLPEPANGKDEEGEDPLNDEHYFKAHRRHERQEKQLRNIERDRAQHEKQTLDRLLDELKSQEWLRVLGITGRISEQEKKQYEPKRDYFIAEISAVLRKFQIWKEEEKRRKTDKDRPASFYSDAITTVDSLHAKDKDNGTKDEEDVSEPPQDDVDALAARQLLQEARSATAGKRPKSKPEPNELPPLPPDPPKPFTSFFAKPQLRAQAMAPGNRKGRTRLAFGHPVPEVEEKEFELPGDILTPEAIKDCQRKRRRMKRASLT
ncbi:something about silencing, SAS, complex subunit 4-domain-containing protein [Aspergillus unguis]